jgi:O-succinylbenzoate synthase
MRTFSAIISLGLPVDPLVYTGTVALLSCHCDKKSFIVIIHLLSIEQPIKQKQWRDMARLCKESPIAIALDEELIGVNLRSMKEMLLDTIQPQYIVLKPSLHGGMMGSQEWVELAKARGIGSWMTSALESNVGLNAIAHLAARTYGTDEIMPQGLGTGLLFTDNIEMPIELRGEKMYYDNKWFLIAMARQ